MSIRNIRINHRSYPGSLAPRRYPSNGNLMKIVECNYSDPISVVKCFISAMNEWELDAWVSSQEAKKTEDPSSYQSDVLRKLEEIFMKYCTHKKRTYWRLGSFQKPPEYDPNKERIIKSQIQSSRKAFVDTERDAILGGGFYRYVLYKKAGKWLIDNLKYRIGDEWEKAIL